MKIAWLLLFAFCACNDHGKGGVADATGDTTLGKVCGGLGDAQCGPSEFCDFGTNDCGAADGTGFCTPRPTTCPDIVAVPTCACDGKVYGGTCDAAMAGFDVNANGSCPLAQGKFACGFTQCDLATTYCKRERHTGSADTFSCVALPACASQLPTCSCLANEPCGAACTGSGATGLTVTCS